MKSLLPNDAHLPRDGSAALSQSDASIPSTQAAFTDSHHANIVCDLRFDFGGFA